MGYVAFIDKNYGMRSKPKWLQVVRMPRDFAKSYRLKVIAKNKAEKRKDELLRTRQFRGASLRIKTRKVKF